MDLFTFDDVAVFDTDYGFGDQTGLDTQYNVDEVAVYDTQCTYGGTTIDETQVTVDGMPVLDQVTVIDSPVYYDPQLVVADAPLYDPQLIVNDTTISGDPVLTPSLPGATTDVQVTVVDTPATLSPDFYAPATETTIINEQYVVSDTPSYLAPGYPYVDPGVLYSQPVVANNGVPVSQTYTDTSLQGSFQAQWTTDGGTPASNTPGVSNTQQPGTQQAGAQQAGRPNAQHPGRPYAQYPVHQIPANRPPGAATVAQGVPVASQGAQSPVHSIPASAQGISIPAQNIPISSQGIPISSQGIPISSQSAPVSPQGIPVYSQGIAAYQQGVSTAHHGVPTAQHAGRPSLAVRPQTFHGGRPSLMHGLAATAHNPVVNTLVTKPIGSLMALGRKPKAQALMQGLSVSSPGGTVMNMVTSSVKATSDLCVGLVQSGNIAAPDIGTLAVNTVSLAWKAGAYAYHRAGMKKQLALCLHEYCAAGHLKLHQDFLNPKMSTWKTTSAFHDAKILLRVYKDIDQYLKAAKVSDAEMDALGWRSPVTIYTEKKMPNAVQQLSSRCDSFGVRNVTKTDLETRFNVVSFPHIGVISLTNAFLAEGERRRRRELAGQPSDHHLVPVLGRVLSLAAMCGINEICLSDITLLLGKAPLFETVARARIAALRNHHASHVINSLLFGGSTESAARDFAQQALQFKDQRMLVGRVVAPMTAHFDPVWANAHCTFTGPVDADQPIGTPIYMLAGWARLIVQRELLPTGPAVNVANAASQPICAEHDVHGNIIAHPGRLGPLTFTVKALSDGTLMAKPRKFDRWDYLGSSDYKQGRATASATGEEKHFGGVVGPAHCGCVADQSKGVLTRNWKYSEELGISSRKTVLNSIQHTRELTAKKVSILWSPGDWAKGVFWMQTLPQSSYLQGRGECLHCAVENAALVGCPEVIACGGGRVTAAARRAASGISNVNQAVRPSNSAVPGTPVQHVVTSATSPQITPSPAYVSPIAAPERKPSVNSAVPPASISVGESINKPAGVGKTMSVRRKPVGSAASGVVRKPLVQATITEIQPAPSLSPINEPARSQSDIVAPDPQRKATPPQMAKRKPVVVVEQKAPVVSTSEYPVDLC